MPPPQVPSLQINALISKLRSVADEIHHHTSKMTMQDFKRLLFRTASALITIPESELVQELVALPFVAFTQSSIAAGIEAWTWLIGERPDLEISLMTDISEAWAETIKLRKGLFSPSMKCVLLSCLTNPWLTSCVSFDDPFNRPVEYSATDKALIDRTVMTGKRLLGPHTQLLRMLLSRFQAVRYRRPGLMLLITRLVLRTTRNHKSFRYMLEPSYLLRSDSLSVLSLWRERLASLSLYSAFGSSRAPLWTLTQKLGFEMACIRPHSHGLQFDLSKCLQQSIPIADLSLDGPMAQTVFKLTLTSNSSTSSSIHSKLTPFGG